MPSSDRIPELYRMLAAMSSSEEKVVLRESSPEVRSAVWRYHLEQVLASDLVLSGQQKEILSEGIALLANGVGLFEQEQEERASERLNEFKTRARAAFPDELLYPIFFKVGGHLLLRSRN